MNPKKYGLVCDRQTNKMSIMMKEGKSIEKERTGQKSPEKN